MSSVRAERLVNLVLCLLSSRQFLPAERIRSTVPGYSDAPSDEAFFRMFERDKNELRELGVPLETGRRSSFDTQDGYRIARQDYELGEIDLEPGEAAAVALAARLWDSPELAGAAQGALLKLRAAGVEVDEEQGRVQPRVQASEPAFAPLLAAVQAGRAVRFAHRRGGPTGEVQQRTVEPWGVVSWRGRWYLVGHDRDRDDVRSFRLSRIVAPVTPVGPAGAVARRRRRPHGADQAQLRPGTGDRHRPAVGRGGPGPRSAQARPGHRPARARRAGGRRARDGRPQPRHGGQVDRRARARRGGAGAPGARGGRSGATWRAPPPRTP